MLDHLTDIFKIADKGPQASISDYILHHQDIRRHTNQCCLSWALKWELKEGWTKVSPALMQTIAVGFVSDVNKMDGPRREDEALTNLIHGVENSPELVSVVIQAADHARTPYIFLNTLKTISQRCEAKLDSDPGRFAELGQFKFGSVLRHLDTLCHRKDWGRVVSLVQASVHHPDARQLTIGKLKGILERMHADHAPEACVDLLHAFKEYPSQIATVDPRILEALPQQLASRGRQDKVQVLEGICESLASRRQQALDLPDERQKPAPAVRRGLGV